MAYTIQTRRMIGGTAPWRIVFIDRLIDRVGQELRRREGLNDCTTARLYRATKRHPDLTARRDDLYRRRGEAQAYRDRMAHKDWQRAERLQHRTEDRT